MVAEIYIQNNLSLYSPLGWDQQNEDKTKSRQQKQLFHEKITRKERYGGSKQFLAPLMRRFNYCLSLDATVVGSKYRPIIDEHAVIKFVTQ